jgi:hypothetical protein
MTDVITGQLVVEVVADDPPTALWVTGVAVEAIVDDTPVIPDPVTLLIWDGAKSYPPY